MTDRELLEAAAKAAGLHIEWDPYIGDGEDDGGYFIVSNGVTWSPLDNDGDALRLAVKLQIAVDPREDLCWARGNGGIECAHVSPGQDGYESDIYAATRRAIVRAAAALGEKR